MTMEVSAWDPEDILRPDCVWQQYAFAVPTASSGARRGGVLNPGRWIFDFNR